jgi:hypothetical protein
MTVSSSGGASLFHGEIVVTPTLKWLKVQMSQCSSSVTIASPFVNDGIMRFAEISNPKFKRTLITRVKARDFAFGASNLQTLCNLSNNGWSLFSLPSIHAKIYIFDNVTALVTSANSTHAGLTQNLECGISIEDPVTIKNLDESLRNGLGGITKPEKLHIRDLEAIRARVELVRKTVSEYPDQSMVEIIANPDDFILSFPSKDVILDTFTGWKKLTMECIIHLNKNEFNLSEIYSLGVPIAAKRYPQNFTSKDKLRQQLQFLAHEGWIVFLGHGKYKRLFLL